MIENQDNLDLIVRFRFSNGSLEKTLTYNNLIIKDLSNEKVFT